MAVVVRRKALIQMSTTYGGFIEHIRATMRTGVLRYGEMASSKARNILYTTSYPNATHRKKLQNLFDYDIRCASPYLMLREHYSHDGTLAMIPSKLKETEFHVPTRFPAMIQMLDLLRPGLHTDQLHLYDNIINSFFNGHMSTPRTLDELYQYQVLFRFQICLP